MITTTKSVRHQTPSWSAVLREQFRAVGTLARRELILIGIVMAGLSLLAAGNAVLTGTAVDIHPQALNLPAALLGLFGPLAVWKKDSPSQRGYFWSMPVDRARHTVVKVLDGWGWLMLLLGAYLLWSVGLVVLTGGELGIQETRLVAPGTGSSGELSVDSLSRVQWITPLWLWFVPFTAATATYLLGSVAALRSDVPWLWFGGVVVAFLLLMQTAEYTGLHGMSDLLLSITSGPYGLEVLAGDEVMATALLDRLLHRCHVINIKGRSYRLRDLERVLQDGEPSQPKTGR